MAAATAEPAAPQDVVTAVAHKASATATSWASKAVQLPTRVVRALLSPSSGEGLLGLLPEFIRSWLPGWDTERDMPDMAAEQIKEEFPWAKLTLLQADMSSLKSVRQLADVFMSAGTSLHVLVNNAGVLAPGPFALTEEGFEQTLATNFFGPLYLTLLLAPRLRASAPARVVNVASFGEMFGKVHWDDLRGAKLESSGLRAYAASKLYLIMASRELNRRLRGTGVDVFPVHPGIVSSPGESKSDKRYLVSVTAFLNARLHGQSELRGALAPLFAATEPGLQGRGGAYIGPNQMGVQLFGWGGFNTGYGAPPARTYDTPRYRCPPSRLLTVALEDQASTVGR
ncbi:hypothetical protein GPECTOR_2g1010 [Gonium pectorale]|uniref:Uncharacterized protein n=1 Tax=Gonium pectorale TaxID=33097 RepID=A0A150H044_GONPE|nr:hypothetical protein GPECTOR_2g1010 [Gonium pectorale]|eukprot:KXZ55461.1 hypothetical protein GPECTOR_2g1010 [Gonium pectorale]